MTYAQTMALLRAEDEYREADDRVNQLLSALDDAATDAATQRLLAELHQAENAARGALRRLNAVKNVPTLDIAA